VPGLWARWLVHVSLTFARQRLFGLLASSVAHMTLSQFLIVLFAVVIGGLLLPLPHGARMALVLALIALAVLTFIGVGMHYFLRMF
jgi:hypothetical protein